MKSGGKFRPGAGGARIANSKRDVINAHVDEEPRLTDGELRIYGFCAVVLNPAGQEMLSLATLSPTYDLAKGVAYLTHGARAVLRIVRVTVIAD